MKKAIAGTILAGVMLRLAVLAGAADALGDWARERGVDERLVTAALSLELGLAPETAPPEPAEVQEEAPPESSAAPEPDLRLITVTPAPASTPEPEEAPPEIAPLTASLGETASVHNRTQMELDFDALAAAGPALTLPAEGPQVLIIHTHSSEAYTQDDYDRYEASDPYRTEDPNYSVIRVGETLAQRFEAAGLTVLHDTSLYDYPSYTGSYSRSGAAVERYLAEYPSIRVVIDLHRDAIGSGDVVYKTQASLDGRTSAQAMLLVGTGENGLPHPHWQDNLRLALYLQSAVDRRWPSLMRPIELVSERYNQQLCPGMMILEVGSTGNTLREALLAAELFGDAAGPALAELMGE